MIYTVTLNPSLDYIVEVDQVTLGELNRTKNETKFPGGKELMFHKY
jgi:1-phosphofructokinase